MSASVNFPSRNLIDSFAFCFKIWWDGVASERSVVSWIKHFFFFQAKVGIRVGNVTGVQTWALPFGAAAVGGGGWLVGWSVGSGLCGCVGLI